MSSPRIRIGISACLLGHPVRYNGGHEYSTLCNEIFSEHFEFIPCCPEQAIGLSTPRTPLRLVGEPTAPRVRSTTGASLDVTDALTAYGERVAAESGELNGYILMQRSPSCGMERIKVYRDDGLPASATGRGVVAAALMRARPDLPVEEEGRLHDPVLRENFITRVFAHARWQELQRDGLTRKGLIHFHQGYKYLLMANDREEYRRLGRMVAQIGEQPLSEFASNYFQQLMQALSKPATRGSHTNVLQHLCGYLKKVLSGAEKQELQRLVDQYRSGVVPLVVPLTLIKHHFRRYPDSYIEKQAYLQPHPEDWGLRNAL